MIDIHDYSRRLESAMRRLAQLEYSGILLGFIDHLLATGISKGRVAKIVNHLCTIFRNRPFNPSNAELKPS